MSSWHKTLEDIVENPKNVRFESLDTVLQRIGYKKRNAGGSHVVYTCRGKDPLTIPFRRPVLKEYIVKEVIAKAGLKEKMNETLKG